MPEAPADSTCSLSKKHPSLQGEELQMKVDNHLLSLNKQAHDKHMTRAKKAESLLYKVDWGECIFERDI